MPTVPAPPTTARHQVVGPIFDAVDRVLHKRDEYRRFRAGALGRAEYARFLDDAAAELMAQGVPADDIHYAKRYPASIPGFVDEMLADLVARGVLSTATYNRGLLSAVEASAALYDHGGYATYIYPEEARLLFALADITRPKRALFLGSYYGYWAYWALSSIVAGGGRAVLVDPDPHVQQVARGNVARSGFVDSVEIVVSTGEEFLGASRGTFDFVVLDAEGPRDHPEPEQRGKRVYRPLLTHALPRLAPGALLVCHNILLSDPSGAPFFDQVIERNRDELGPFLDLVQREIESFKEYTSTEGVGVGRRRMQQAAGGS